LREGAKAQRREASAEIPNGLGRSGPIRLKALRASGGFVPLSLCAFPLKKQACWEAKRRYGPCRAPVSASVAWHRSGATAIGGRYAVRCPWYQRGGGAVDPNAIKEWAGALAPYVAFFTAFWAILTYRRARKVEVARLQKQIFDDLFLSGKFHAIREALDWDYAKKMGPMLQTLQAKPAEIGQAGRTILELDNFLNLIEYVLYLEQDKKLLTAADRKALLAYWIDVVGREPELRAYVARYNYERLAACLSAEGA
jgi:hypothetical protein